MALNKHEFIQSLLSRFSYYTEKDDKGSFYDTYSRVLTRKIDYDKLWDKFCNEYAGKTPPTGVEIKNLAKSCYLDELKNDIAKWLHVAIYEPRYKAVTRDTCFPVNTTDEQILNFFKNKFGCDGWEIREKYTL